MAFLLLMSKAEQLFICLLTICVSSFKPQISTVRETSMGLCLKRMTPLLMSHECALNPPLLLVKGKSDEVFRKGIVT